MMKIIIILLSLLLFGEILSKAQVSYAYDGNGNRIARELVIGSNKSATLMDDFEESPLTDYLDKLEINIYPNPTRGLLRVNMAAMGDETISMFIYDINGVKVYENDKADNVNAIDLANRPNGIYVMVITNGKNKRTWRIIKK